MHKYVTLGIRHCQSQLLTRCTEIYRRGAYTFSHQLGCRNLPRSITRPVLAEQSLCRLWTFFWWRSSRFLHTRIACRVTCCASLYNSGASLYKGRVCLGVTHDSAGCATRARSHCRWSQKVNDWSSDSSSGNSSSTLSTAVPVSVSSVKAKFHWDQFLVTSSWRR